MTVDSRWRAVYHRGMPATGIDPAYLTSVAGPVTAGTADLVLGAREAERGAWPPHARLANRYLARRIRRSFDIEVSDLGPMRAMRRVDVVTRATSLPLAASSTNITFQVSAGTRIEPLVPEIVFVVPPFDPLPPCPDPPLMMYSSLPLLLTSVLR